MKLFSIKHPKDSLLVLNKLPDERHFCALKLCSSEASAVNKYGVWGRSSPGKISEIRAKKNVFTKKTLKGNGGPGCGDEDEFETIRTGPDAKMNTRMLSPRVQSRQPRGGRRGK